LNIKKLIKTQGLGMNKVITMTDHGRQRPVLALLDKERTYPDLILGHNSTNETGMHFDLWANQMKTLTLFTRTADRNLEIEGAEAECSHRNKIESHVSDLETTWKL
jgi:hypothetical protein